MNKKLRKLIKKRISEEFLKLNNAFSLVEIAVSLLVISIIIAALTPTISKRLSATSSVKNRISTNCNSLYPDGYCAMCYTTPKKCVVCTKNCASNQFKNVDNCVCEDCSKKYNNPNCSKCSSKACTQCKDGYFLDSKNNCTICPKGYRCFQQGDASVKLPCEKGTVAGAAGMSSCVKCNQSTSTQTGTVATSTAMTACVACQPGSYAKKQGQGTGCEACPKGYYCPQGKYIPCPKGTANASTGQTVCSSCLQSTNTRQGSVAVNTAMTSCTLCGNGTYAKVSAQTSACETCPLGHYCPQGKLIPCPQGTAQSSYGQTACVSCVKSTSTQTGTVAPSTGQTTCTACTGGTYASANGQKTNCQSCPKGYACSNGKLTQCGVGTISTGGATSCKACSGATTAPAGASACVACTGGCSACYNTASNCTSCNAGYYKNGTNCTKCQAGKYCAGGTAGQQSCPVGYVSSAGASSCTSCGSGKTSVNNACQSCSPSCASCSGSTTNCSDCKSGYYITSSTCTTCPAGYYCKDNKKTICPENNYCPQGATTPITCPENTTSPQGSKSESECESEEWECRIEVDSGSSGSSTGGNTLTLPSGNHFEVDKYFGNTGKKYGKLCVMDEKLRQKYLSNKSKNPNLTWTPITESNVGSLCQDPTEQNFRFIVGGGCTGYTEAYSRVTSKSDLFTEYASSCKITVLSCGRVDEPEECDVYKLQPEPHKYNPLTTKTLIERSTFGTKNIKTMYSKQVLPGIKWCQNDGSIKYGYYYFYTSASSSYCQDYGCYCGIKFMRWAQQENKYFIVTKKGK